MRRLILFVVLLIGLGSMGEGANWDGFWGAKEYPGTSGEKEGRWINFPLCWGFDDTGIRTWTTNEKNVVNTAIQDWNQIQPLALNFVNLYPYGLVVDFSNPTCPDPNSPDIVFRWSYLSGQAGKYVPEVAAMVIGTPCVTSGLPRCNVIVLNSQETWYIDPTPGDDEEYMTTSVNFCGLTTPHSIASPASEAWNKRDLYTIASHEFGHALGLIHTEGCDGDVTTPKSGGDYSDDDGKLMWGGELQGFREPGSFPPIGLGERRRIGADTIELFNAQYPSIAGLTIEESGCEERGAEAPAVLAGEFATLLISVLTPEEGSGRFIAITDVADVGEGEEGETVLVAGPILSGESEIAEIAVPETLGRHTFELLVWNSGEEFESPESELLVQSRATCTFEVIGEGI